MPPLGKVSLLPVFALFFTAFLLLTSCRSGVEVSEGVVTIGGEPACDSCRIELVHLARLGKDPDGFLMGETMVVSKDSRNRWFVTGPYHPSVARVFEFDGEYLGDFGAEGEGPGEFRSVVDLLEYPEGTLTVWDGGNNRFSRFTLEFGFIDQCIPEVRPLRRASTTTGVLGINALRFTEAGEVLPLHLLDREGKILHSFGRQEPPLERGPPGGEHFRSISPSFGGGVWAGIRTRYEIEHWDSGGESTVILRRGVDWFRPHSDLAFRMDPNDQPPKPRLEDIREDAAGRLWTLVHLPNEHWREGFRPDTLQSGLIWSEPVLEEHYQARIEVLDPETGTVLAGLVTDELMDRFVAAPFGEVFLYSFSSSPLGEPYVDLWAPRLIINP